MALEAHEGTRAARGRQADCCRRLPVRVDPPEAGWEPHERAVVRRGPVRSRCAASPPCPAHGP
eukprot:4273893-Lingulodinium_polyedra.AAC.1